MEDKINKSDENNPLYSTQKIWYYIDEHGYVKSKYNWGSDFEYDMVKIGNYYATKKLALIELLKFKAKHFIKEIWKEFNDYDYRYFKYNEQNWTVGYNGKNIIPIMHDSIKILEDYMYFDTKEDVLKLIKYSNNEKNIIDMLFKNTKDDNI